MCLPLSRRFFHGDYEKLTTVCVRSRIGHSDHTSRDFIFGGNFVLEFVARPACAIYGLVASFRQRISPLDKILCHSVKKSSVIKDFSASFAKLLPASGAVPVANCASISPKLVISTAPEKVSAFRAVLLSEPFDFPNPEKTNNPASIKGRLW